MSTDSSTPAEIETTPLLLADILSGQNGADRLTGGSGQDDLKGQTGPDTLHGDAHDDTRAGGNGNDTLFGGSGLDRCSGNLAATTKPKLRRVNRHPASTRSSEGLNLS